jgi:glycosyltransferase involved in cell wall biosynthesis
LPRKAKPVVSCVIIFLNEEKYLAEAIESVIAQSFADWELLLVDDGSTDRSEEISRTYCERSPGKIRYLSHEGRANRGMSASRNLGLREARGEFAAFLDGDDSWYPNKLERQVALFRQHPGAIMVCGATLYWHSWNASADGNDRIMQVGEWAREEGSAGRALADERLYEGRELMRKLYPLGKGVSPSMSGNMFRREILLALGGFDESFRGLFEDQVIRAKIYLNGPVYVSHDVFDRYRQHDESCFRVAKATGRSEEPRRQFFLWLKQYLDEVGCRDPIVRLQLRRKMLRFQYPAIRRAWSRFPAAFRQIAGS